MAANTQPIFTRAPQTNGSVWTSSLTGNTKSDGTGTIDTDMLVAVIADATEGSKIDRLRFTAGASVASTATTATVLRVYLSSVTSGATTRANTIPIAEIACPATTADQPTIAVNAIEVPIGFTLEPGKALLWSMHHAAAANTSWSCAALAGKF